MNTIRKNAFQAFLFLSLLLFIFPISAQNSEGRDYDDFDDEDFLVFEQAPDLVIEASPYVQRSFNDIFPGRTRAEIRSIYSDRGLRNSFDKDGTPILNPTPDSGIDLYSIVKRKNPSHVIEALIVIPYNKRELDILDIYNALGRIEKIKDQTIISRGNPLHIFTDTTRLQNAQNRRAIPDPPPSNRLPLSETMYIRFRDAYIGDLFLRGDITQSLYGMTYNITNFRDINFTIFRIMKAERVSIILYLEPVEEGVLVYSMSGIYLPDFIMDRLNLTANISARISILLNWIAEGLKIQENLAVDRQKEPIEGLLQNEQFNRLINN